jgi:hypothetical protein
VTFSGALVDAAGDSHTASWRLTNDTQETAVAGAVSTPTPATEPDLETKQITGTHTFTQPGVYLVTLEVQDQLLNSAATDVMGPDGLTAMVVIYDPSGGFVNGGGWIQSPVGAYAADPALTGMASFGFVSRYQPGATIPTGNTEFKFKVANFDFRSTSYEWLVVGGPKAQYKGWGKVNGEAGYRFLLTAWDGQRPGGGGTDKFRIKIWNEATGAVVYDNKMGASETGNDATALGGGSVTIHTN